MIQIFVHNFAIFTTQQVSLYSIHIFLRLHQKHNLQQKMSSLIILVYKPLSAMTIPPTAPRSSSSGSECGTINVAGLSA